MKKTIAVLMVACIMVQTTHTSYAVSVATGLGTACAALTGEQILSLLVTAMATAGIATELSDDDKAFLETATTEEKTEFTLTELGAKKEVLEIMLNKGSFAACPELEDYLEGELAGSASVYDFQKYVAAKSSAMSGGTNNDDDNNNNKNPKNGEQMVVNAGTMALFSSDLFGEIVGDFKGAVNIFLKKMGGALQETDEIKILAAPPTELSHVIYQHGENVYCAAFDGLFKGNNPMSIWRSWSGSTTTYKVQCKYHWVYTYDQESASWSESDYFASSSPATTHKFVSFTSSEKFEILYNNVPYDFDESGDVYLANPWVLDEDAADISPEQAVENVNKYLEDNGYRTRYNLDVLEANPDYEELNVNVTDTNGNSSSTNHLVVGDNPEDLILPLTVPLAEPLVDPDTGEDLDPDEIADLVVEKINDNQAETVTKNEPVEPETLDTVSSDPYSPNLGTHGNYVVDGLEDVFPFCIPFDIYECIKVMSSSGEAPYVEIPLKYGNVLDYTIVWDMSKFETVAKISRWIETIIFIYVLASKSKQYIFT